MNAKSFLFHHGFLKNVLDVFCVVIVQLMETESVLLRLSLALRQIFGRLQQTGPVGQSEAASPFPPLADAAATPFLLLGNVVSFPVAPTYLLTYLRLRSTYY